MKNESVFKEFHKEYIYEGLGFPVKLHNVVMVQDRDYVYPLISLNEITLKVAMQLIHRHEKLDGARLKFLRKFCQASLDDFAKRLGVSKTTILNWEKSSRNKIIDLSEVQIRSIYATVGRTIVSSFSETIEESIIKDSSSANDAGEPFELEDLQLKVAY
jgi:transcriptional regulator with XRE-family HTH domain